MKAYRGKILHFKSNPNDEEDPNNSYEYILDGILFINNGHIFALCLDGKYLMDMVNDETISNDMNINSPNSQGEILKSQFLDIISNNNLKIYQSTQLIVPAFIDCHIHFPQVKIMASYGNELLEWLNRYTLPHEKKFHDKDFALKIANIFCEELVRNGTTTALVMGTAHTTSIDALCEVASSEKYNLRIICGQAISDQNMPDELTVTPEECHAQCHELYNRWNNVNRIKYALTPRFSPSCSNDMLSMIGTLANELDDVYIHTHLSENPSEVEWVKSLFPESKDYLDTYEQHGLVRPRSIYAHSIYLNDSEWERLTNNGAAIAFCPCSNTFLGSGLFDWQKGCEMSTRIGLGTDVGGGPSFSLLRNAGEAYKVVQLQRKEKKFDPISAFYLLTLGGARALYLDDKVGNFEVGKEADFLVLEENATNILKTRMEDCDELFEKLFAWTVLGDDRCINECYSMGKLMELDN